MDSVGLLPSRGGTSLTLAVRISRRRSLSTYSDLLSVLTVYAPLHTFRLCNSAAIVSDGPVLVPKRLPVQVLQIHSPFVLQIVSPMRWIRRYNGLMIVGKYKVVPR